MIPPKFKNPNIGMKSMSDYKWNKDGIPTRENCDLDSPREMFLWMQVAPPGLNGGPMMYGPEYSMMVSEHYWELGAMLKCESCGHVKEPLKKYRPPTAHDPHWATSPGLWVPMSTPDPPPERPAKRAWDGLSPVQKAEILEIGLAERESEPE